MNCNYFTYKELIHKGIGVSNVTINRNYFTYKELIHKGIGVSDVTIIRNYFTYKELIPLKCISCRTKTVL